MEVKILEETKNKLVIESDNSTVLNLLVKMLWGDSHVKVAGQERKHPLVGKPTLIIETDGKESAKDALSAAIKTGKKECDKFKKAFK